MTIAERNALLPKLSATRASRDRIRAVADLAAHQLHEVAVACSPDDASFTRQQNSTDQSLAAAIVRLASIKATITEIETALPALKTVWEA